MSQYLNGFKKFSSLNTLIILELYSILLNLHENYIIVHLKYGYNLEKVTLFRITFLFRVCL